MKKAKTKRFLISLVAFVLLFGTLLSALSTLLIAHGEFYSSAVSSVVLEANSKRVIFSKNMDKKLPMASTTKIMTAITALENCKDLD